MTDLKTAANAKRFTGKVALVVGAGPGAGLACAARLGLEGAQVVAAARSEENVNGAAETLTRLGIDHVVFRGDASTAEGALAAVALAMREFGGIDIVVCSAGGFEGGGVDKADEAQLERMLSMNLRAAFSTAKASAPALIERGGGVIVVTTAVFGAVVPGPGLLAYNTSKAAAAGLCQSLAGDLAPSGIRVNAVLPGAISHEFDDTADPAHERALLKGSAMPQDIAAAVAFLASDDACFITGAELVVDGGFSVSRKPY